MFFQLAITSNVQFFLSDMLELRYVFCPGARLKVQPLLHMPERFINRSLEEDTLSFDHCVTDYAQAYV